MRQGFEPCLGRVRKRGPTGISRPPERAPTPAPRPDSVSACQPVSVLPMAPGWGAARDERSVEIPSRKQAGLLHGGWLGPGLRCHLTQTPCLHPCCPGRAPPATLRPSANREAHPGVISSWVTTPAPAPDRGLDRARARCRAQRVVHMDSLGAPGMSAPPGR